MDIKGSITNFLSLGLKKEIEQLRETVATQELLMKKGEEPKSVTLTSALSQETREAKDWQNLVLKRIDVKDLQLLYLNNQFIFRGVNVRADETIARGFKILEGDDTGIKACEELVKNSGGENLIWQLSVNTDVAGNGYLEKATNESKDRIALLKHVNPINFGFWTDETDKNTIVLDDNRIPKAYMQVVTDKQGTEKRIEVSKDKIAHLRFNTFGDEFGGISSLQPVYNTAIRLMNMEHAAAEAAVKTANPTWVVKTQTKSPTELNKWANVLGRVSGKDVVFLPEGVEIDLKSPGPQNFSDYSEYFLDAVVAALGVPKSILTGGSDSGGGNRATVQTLSKHFYSVIRSNQRYIEQLFNKIFIEYGEMAGFKPPKLVFNDLAEDADRNGQRAVDLYGSNLVTLEEARDMVGLETSPETKKKLEEKAMPPPVTGKIDPKAADKKADMKTFHTATPGSPEGSQKGEKKQKKADTDVKSVK